MKVPFKMPEIFPHTLGGGLEIWASIYKNILPQKSKTRGPEEKVKGHSGANNREPQGHNLNKFGRVPFHDVIY